MLLKKALDEIRSKPAPNTFVRITRTRRSKFNSSLMGLMTAKRLRDVA